MSNTTQRILSAFFLMGLFGLSLYFGKVTTIIFIGIFAFICSFEFSITFLKSKISSGITILGALSFLLVFLPVNYFGFEGELSFSYVNRIAILFNIGLLAYLFVTDLESKSFINFLRKIPIIVAVYFAVTMSSISSVIVRDNWYSYLWILFFINFGMDTGAWFFGKYFGKKKLWEKVSPKKTVVGLVGGAFTSAVCGGIVWYLVFDQINPVLFILFILLGTMSQVGDLIQSKIKRQFGVKDSSQLIPGHGGVYDRVDSLLFLAPFYAEVLEYYYFVQ